MNISNPFATPQLLITTKDGIYHYGQQYYESFDISHVQASLGQQYHTTVTSTKQPLDKLLYNVDNLRLVAPLGKCLSTRNVNLRPICLGLIDDSSFALARISRSTSSFYVPLVGFPLLSNSAISNYDEYRDHAILSFGGSSMNGTTTDSNLYMIDPISYTWKIITSSSISPPPRKGACLLNVRQPLTPFSGSESSLNPDRPEGTILLLYGDSKDVDGYTITHNDAWLGRIDINGNFVSWERLSFPFQFSDSIRRTGQSCLYLEDPRKIFVYGGVNENGTDIESVSLFPYFLISLFPYFLISLFPIVYGTEKILHVEEIRELLLPPIDNPIAVNAENNTLVLTSGFDSASSGYYALDLSKEPKWTFSSSYQPFKLQRLGESVSKIDYTLVIVYGVFCGVLLLTLLWYNKHFSP
jgi:hypothetical protein